MSSMYPTSLTEINTWAREAGVPATEARVRFAQYAVLQGITSVRPLREGLVFKGGNALDFIWQPNRSTADLDFSIDHASVLANPDAAAIQVLLERAVAAVRVPLGVIMKVGRVRANPPGEDRQFVTFRARLMYVLPSDPSRLQQRLEQGESIPQGIDLDISINEPIGATELKELGPGVHIRVATIEDIVAEKLRALLQQPLRDRQRRQDLLDIAVILQARPDLDRTLVAELLQDKAAARAVPVSRSAFRSAEVAERASMGYAALEATTRVRFVPFAEARDLLYAFVDELPIPD